MATKLTEANLQQIGVFTKELYDLKAKHEDYTESDFEYEFNKIRDKFKNNSLPFEYDFYEFTKDCEFYEYEESSSYYEEEDSYDD